MARAQRFQDVALQAAYDSAYEEVVLAEARRARLDLPAAAAAPPQFPDLSDVDGTFTQARGAFLVAEHDGRLIGMGGRVPAQCRRTG